MGHMGWSTHSGWGDIDLAAQSGPYPVRRLVEKAVWLSSMASFLFWMRRSAASQEKDPWRLTPGHACNTGYG